MADFIICVATKVAEYMVGPIRRHMSYLFKHHHHVEDLNKKIEQLDRVRERVGYLVRVAGTQGDEIVPHVEKWLEEARGIIQKKEELAEDVKQASKSCFHLKSRYRLSKKAEKQALDIDDKLGQARDFGDTVSRPPPPPPLVSSASSQKCEAFPSRQSTFDQIMVALRNEETSMVGIWGMGGVGKTTLALQVAKRAKEEKLFHKVLMARGISKTPNISEIQREIARTLGLTFQKGDERADRLKNSLKNSLKKEEKILVILDDIWNKLDLEKIGIPYGHEHKGCKLLLTSTDRGVLYSDMEAQQVFPLRRLDAQEAWSLFKMRAGDSVESPEIRPIAEEIVKHCEGLPVAIVTIASALKKWKRAPEWKNSLEELKNAAPKNVSGVSDKVYSCLELSYKHLQSDESKSLFLLCGLVEDAHISMDRLLQYAMALNLFEELYWEKATNKVITLVGILKDSSLLLDPDQEGSNGGYGSLFFDDAFVKMHDVVRDVARSIGSNDACVVREASKLLQLERTDKCRDYTRISLKCGDKDELPKRLVCPKLELFLLNSSPNSDGRRYKWTIPDGFFQETKQLRVLDLNGLSLGPSPSFLGFLSNLRALYLNDCQLYDLSWATIGELKKLQVLSLAKSDIIELPEDVMQLSDLRVLDLRDCSGLRIIPRDVISSLSRLEYLSLKGCGRIEWERDGVNRSGEGNMKACLSEIKHLPQLKTLVVEVSDPRFLPEDELPIHNDVNLSRYSIVIGSTRSANVDNSRLSRNLEVCGLENESVQAVLNGVSRLLRSCQELSLGELGDIKDVVYELDGDHGFVELKNLVVERCPNIESILGPRNWVPPRDTLCKLEQLDLSDLDNLEAVCQGPIPVGCCRNLRLLQLRGCSRLKYVLSSSTMELVTHLQDLIMEDLPELISFFYSTTTTAGSQDTIPIFNGQNVFPALESIFIDSLDGMKALWYKPQISANFFSRLKELKVSLCHKLPDVFPLSVAKSLGQLEKLWIESCEVVKEIVTRDDQDETEIVTRDDQDETTASLSLFPNLISLTLTDLPRLEKFCYKRFASRWPRLMSLALGECDKVEIVFVQETGVEGGGLATTKIQQPFFILQKDAFPALKSLLMVGLDGMRALWYNPQIAADFFSRLKELKVYLCHKLLNVFPLSVVKSLGQLEKLQIESCRGVEEIVTGHDQDETTASLSLFPNLTTLILKYLPQLKKFCSKRFASRWPRLKSLELLGCDKVEILFVQETGVEGGGLAATEIQQPFFILQKDSFPALESLSIQCCDGMRALWYSPQISVDFFPRLLQLYVVSCGKLVNVFPLSVAKALGQLQHLRILSCEGVEEIVTGHDQDETTASLSLFPNLTMLLLSYLPQLKKLCSKRFASRWPRLKNLELVGCYKVKIVFVQETGVEGGGLATTEIQQPFFILQKGAFPNLEELRIIHLTGAVEIWSGQFSGVSFSKLRKLEIQECHCMSAAIIPMTVVQALYNLKVLRVVSCGSLNEVIQVVDGGQPPTNDEIDFHRLMRLDLVDLPNLKSFCSTSCTLRFSSLEYVVVKKCPKMEFFCKGDLHTPRLKHNPILGNRGTIIEETDDDED